MGSADNHVIVAGCQIHYAVKCNARPDTGEVTESLPENGRYIQSTRETEIYIAE